MKSKSSKSPALHTNFLLLIDLSFPYLKGKYIAEKDLLGSAQKLLILVSVLFSFTCCGSLKYSVLFGERDTRLDFEKIKTVAVEKNDSLNVIRIFVDRMGLIYPPDVYIPDSYIASNDHTLQPRLSGDISFINNYKRYIEDPQIKVKLNAYEFLMNNIPRKENSSTDLDTTQFFLQFNSISVDLIMAKVAALKSNNYTFMLNGYNNTFVNANDSYNTSENKLRLQRRKIQGLLDIHNFRNPADQRKTTYVEVHWDGTFKEKQGITVGLNLTPATITSFKVGLALRMLLNRIDSISNTINIFGHSTGANIICETLFNQRIRLNANHKKTRPIYEFLSNIDGKIQTPFCAKVNAILTESSIPGVEAFQDYYKRTLPPGIPFEMDNYTIYIGYNINDPVAKKNFNRSINFLFNGDDKLTKAKKVVNKSLGSTALACIKEEVEKVELLFMQKYRLENIKIYDFSTNLANGHRAPNSFHDILFYFGLDDYNSLLTDVYKIK